MPRFWPLTRTTKTITCRLCERPLTERDWIRPWRLCRWPCHYAVISGFPWFRIAGMRADGFLRREGIRTEERINGTITVARRHLTADEFARVQDWGRFYMIAHGMTSWSRDYSGGSFRRLEAPLIAWYTTADVDALKRREAWTRAEEFLTESGDWGVWAGYLIDQWEARHDEASYWSLVEVLLPDHKSVTEPGISLEAVVSS